MIRVCSCDRPLPISSVAPLRSTMATSSAPDMLSTARKPSPIDSTPMSTVTTPAMPTSATTDERQRSRHVAQVHARDGADLANAVVRHRSFRSSSLAQRVDDLQSRRLRATAMRAASAPSTTISTAPMTHVAGGMPSTGKNCATRLRRSRSARERRQAEADQRRRAP